MAFDLSKLFPSKFRDVAFLTDDVQDSGGQKTITHEFVNSDDRIVESVGILRPTFAVMAIVTGDNYFTDRDRLVAAMELNENGVFVHPFRGKITVFPISYVVNQTDRQLGQAIITLVFQEVRNSFTGLPTEDDISLTTIGAKATTAGSAIATLIGENLTFTSTANFLAIKDNLEAVGDAFQAVISTTASLTDEISTSQALVDNFKDDLSSLIATPQVLGTRLIGLFASVIDLAATPEASFSSLKQFFSFGDSIGADENTTFTPITPDNRLSAEKQKNQNLIKTCIQANALVQSYVSASEIEYGTVVDLDTAVADLETQFDKTVGQVEIGDPSVDTVVEMDISSIKGVSDVRDDVTEFLNLERVNTSKLTSVKTRLTSMSVLAFKYYGDVNRLEQLISINDPGDVSNILGTIQVITE